ncbi:hypothetical protein I5907_02005 [Panacibacter sp. DH6]|uniref:Uncharacterized protein n=1 Tax=Panacibacter microcysteis TaxID=2793269 RepID=A0A931GX40_9BACT|nr:hypothetical protein [Panacibacter microcysteis]MBG9374984.1 hypothetical protein [Panacibacter microcysteis]
MRYLIAILCIALNVVVYGQTTEHDSADTMQSRVNTLTSIPGKSLEYIEKKYSRLSSTIQKQNEKVLQRMQEKEDKIRKKLAVTDSLKAAALFGKSEERYRSLKDKLQQKLKLREYIPGLDTVATGLQFFSQSQMPVDVDALKLDELSNSISDLQSRLQQANEIQTFVRLREKELKEQLMNTGLARELLSVNKEVFYYQQRLKEYKELLNDRKKLEKRLVTEVRRIPAFEKFMEKHSYLTALFPQPDNYGTVEALQGLQTRSSVQQMLQQSMGTTALNPEQYIQQQMQTAQTALNDLKDKINKLGGSEGNSDMTMPDFKPNNQKTKSFLERIEYGFNLQSSRTTNLLPATSDMAVTAGYKFSDKASAGLGVSYKIGWGSGLNSIKLTSQGVGLRSYVDVKAKGNLWITGGFEYNYMQEFKKLQELYNVSTWGKSALAGATKKIKIGKKRETKIQLLYDFLATRQIPQTQPLKFRIGYTF